MRCQRRRKIYFSFFLEILENIVYINIVKSCFRKGLKIFYLKTMANVYVFGTDNEEK